MNLIKNILWVLITCSVYSCQIFHKSENQLIREYYNPEQGLKVVVFEKKGNATTNNSIQASIKGYPYELNDKEVGNVFVADQFENSEISKDSILIVKWVDNETVEFILYPKIRILKKEIYFKDNFGQVKIIHQTTKKIDLTKIPDSLELILDKNMTGDFNGDGKMDFASIVKNTISNKLGVLIIHNSQNHEIFVFGAGKEVNQMDDLNWIEVFKMLPQGEIISPTLVDEISGDIIGQDETQNFKLIGNGIYISVEESHGGGIIFWNGNEYKWYHIE